MEEGRRRHLGSGLRRRGKQRKRKKKRRLASSRPVNNRQPRPTVDRWTGRKQPRPGPAQSFLVADRMVSTLKQKVPLRNNALANTCTTFGCRIWNWHWQLQMSTVWMSWNLGLEISTNTNQYQLVFLSPAPPHPQCRADPSVFAGIGLRLSRVMLPFLPRELRRRLPLSPFLRW